MNEYDKITISANRASIDFSTEEWEYLSKNIIQKTIVFVDGLMEDLDKGLIPKELVGNLALEENTHKRVKKKLKYLIPTINTE